MFWLQVPPVLSRIYVLLWLVHRVQSTVRYYPHLVHSVVMYTMKVYELDSVGGSVAVLSGGEQVFNFLKHGVAGNCLLYKEAPCYTSQNSDG